MAILTHYNFLTPSLLAKICVTKREKVHLKSKYPPLPTWSILLTALIWKVSCNTCRESMALAGGGGLQDTEAEVVGSMNLVEKYRELSS